MLGAGLPEVLADLFVSFDVATARGYFAVTSGAVRELTEQDPQSLAEFFQSRKELLLGRRTDGPALPSYPMAHVALPAANVQTKREEVG